MAKATLVDMAKEPTLVDYAFLIERTDYVPPVWYGFKDGGVHWTNDVAEAIQFHRAEDAQHIIDAFGFSNCKPVEHCW